MTKFWNNLGVRKTYLTMTQNPEAIKEKTDIFDYIFYKFKKTFLQGKNPISKVKTQMTNWKEHLQLISQKDYIKRFYPSR